MLGCPIRKSADQRPFAPTRGLSQLITSFIACESLGIRHTPFTTFARTELVLNRARLIILSAFLFLYHIFHVIVNCQLSTVNYTKAWRFALHFAFAFNMSKNASDLSPEVETRGLGPQCRAGSRLSYYIYYLQRPENCSTFASTSLRTSQYR